MFLGTVLVADQQYVVTGLVLQVDVAARTFLVSHDRVPGLMAAMVMPFSVADGRELSGLEPGTMVEFTLSVSERAATASRIRVRPYQSAEQDPRGARRLGLLARLLGRESEALAIGARVPDVTLVDQRGVPLSLADLRSRVVAVNFVYTRCVLPQFCARVTNDFAVLQRRFENRLGRDLILLTVTFDPERDDPQALARYAARWNAGPAWRFLTGDPGAVRRVCAWFGVEYFPDEGLLTHSLRTAVIDRSGTLVASVEGNRFTPEQLGDLVQTVLGP